MKKIKIDMDLVITMLLSIFLLIFIFSYNSFESEITEFFGYGSNNIGKYDLILLTRQFVYVALLSAICSIFLGFLLGIFCISPWGKDFRIIIEKSATLFQVIPTIALLLLTVTVFGLGIKSAVMVLVVQSILPVLFNTISGLENIPHSYLEIADGLGMTTFQKALKVKLPLAFPIIITGIRISTLICISIATLAFSTGAGGLGLLIQTGISTYNMLFVFEGTVPIVLMAIIVDRILRRLQLKFTYV